MSNNLSSSLIYEDGITKIDKPQRIIYVKNPSFTPVYSQSDETKVIGSSITAGNTTTTVYNSSASFFDIVNPNTLMYIAGGALVLYLIVS